MGFVEHLAPYCHAVLHKLIDEWGLVLRHGHIDDSGESAQVFGHVVGQKLCHVLTTGRGSPHGLTPVVLHIVVGKADGGTADRRSWQYLRGIGQVVVDGCFILTVQLHSHHQFQPQD